MTAKKRPLVFIVCTGLGHINRGYESFTVECFDALKESTAFELYLVKGDGKKNRNEVVIPNLKREGFGASFIAKLLGKTTYYIEQASFCICLIPYIIKKKPALIYYSDFALGSLLWHVRKRLKFSYKLLFANGAPNGPPYKTEDHVQQLLPIYYSIGVKCDGAQKHTLLPYAFNIDIEEKIKGLAQREQIRKHSGFHADQKIVLAVGAVNSSHKRMDYIINEIAGLDEKYFLIILGQFDNETPALKHLAEDKLPGRHIIKNVEQKEVEQYYIAADYFVLASLQEGFPRVTIEALSFGLPCIVQDYIINRQVLQQYGIFIDMRFEKALSNCLLQMKPGAVYKEELVKAAYDNYSWKVLASGYTKMISKQLN